jgi:hypothetical protein
MLLLLCRSKSVRCDLAHSKTNLNVRKTLSLAKSRIAEENMTKRRQLDLQEREICLREFEAGLISKREYRQILKKPVKAHVVDPSSSDWDLE